MAWLSNLAGRAEDLLNKLDHNASRVLQNETAAEWEGGATFEDVSGDGVSIENNEQDSETASEKPDAESEVLIIENVSQTDDESRTSSVEEESETRELRSKFSKLEKRYGNLQVTISNLEVALTDEQIKNTTLNRELQQAKESLIQIHEELEKERLKCQKISKEREKLMAEIKNTPIVTESSELYMEQISKLVKMREDQQTRLDMLSEKFEISQNDLMASEKQCSIYQHDAFAAKQDLQEEKKLKLILEDQLNDKEKEMEILVKEMKKQQQTISTLNKEVSNLKDQMKKTVFTENENLESKFHVLTKTLIMKQNSLETLTTERNALRLQLEKLENEYHNTVQQYQGRQNAILNIDNMEESRAQFPVINPFDAGMIRRVKHTISTLNAFSIRLGVFLRRYPVARLFLLCYMILLQIWVVIILFVYIPSSASKNV